MKLGRIVGTVVSTRKDEKIERALEGGKQEQRAEKDIGDNPEQSRHLRRKRGAEETPAQEVVLGANQQDQRDDKHRARIPGQGNEES